MKMFEEASRLKLRFETGQGFINCEDLWDLPLTHRNRANLDAVAQNLNREIKGQSEESFVVQKDERDTILDLQFDIVKHIIKVKLAESGARKNKVENDAKIKRLREIAADKEEEGLLQKTPEEIAAMIKELGG
jgi:hypothetical protein